MISVHFKRPDLRFHRQFLFLSAVRRWHTTHCEIDCDVVDLKAEFWAVSLQVDIEELFFVEVKLDALDS